MANYMDETNNTATNLLYFAMGGLIGAGVALLLAPQSGKETRDLLTQKAQESKDYLIQKGQELKDQAMQKGQELKEQAADYVDRGLKAAEEGMRAVDAQKERVARAVEAGQETYKRNRAV